MSATMAVDWLYTPQANRPKVDEQLRTVQLARDNMRLLEENARLRRENADLTASAEIWIRLYEAALARANGAPPVALGDSGTRQ
jgi:hypothetical protein